MLYARQGTYYLKHLMESKELTMVPQGTNRVIQNSNQRQDFQGYKKNAIQDSSHEHGKTQMRNMTLKIQTKDNIFKTL